MPVFNVNLANNDTMFIIVHLNGMCVSPVLAIKINNSF